MNSQDAEPTTFVRPRKTPSEELADRLSRCPHCGEMRILIDDGIVCPQRCERVQPVAAFLPLFEQTPGFKDELSNFHPVRRVAMHLACALPEDNDLRSDGACGFDPDDAQLVLRAIFERWRETGNRALSPDDELPGWGRAETAVTRYMRRP